MYSQIMNVAKELSLHVKPKIPRILLPDKKNKDNHPSETIQEFYKRSILIPFIGHVSAQLTAQFAEDARKTIISLLCLVPKQIASLLSEKIPSLTDSLKNYDNDLLRLKSLNNELTTWQNRWAYFLFAYARNVLSFTSAPIYVIILTVGLIIVLLVALSVLWTMFKYILLYSHAGGQLPRKTKGLTALLVHSKPVTWNPFSISTSYFK